MPGKPLLLTAESEDKVALQAFQFTPLCGEQHAMPESDVPDSPFQSMLPCAGSDAYGLGNGFSLCHFNPRSPVRGATMIIFDEYRLKPISIHAPLRGERHAPPCQVL